MRDLHPGLRVLLVAMSCAGVIGLSVEFVDRSVATLVHQTFGGASIFVMMTHIVDPVLPGSAVGIMAAAIGAASGWRPDRKGRTFVACCMAALMAYAIKDQLKYGFGRLWPETWINDNPSWIREGAYGFYPFHGGTGWSSFPSGHMAGISAPMTIVWVRLERWRPLAVGSVVLVALGLIGADYHFVGDVLAGTVVGAASGLGVLATLDAAWSDGVSSPDRQGPDHRGTRGCDADGPALR